MNSKVSVAIPTYNRTAYLKECIQSVLSQTFQDFSVFVFDNASEEPVEELLKGFGDPRIHFVGNEKNIGSAGNINRILNHAFASEYLVIFHDDDAMHPKMLELEAKFLDARQDAAFVVSDLRHVKGDDMLRFQSVSGDAVAFTLYKNQLEFVNAITNWLRYAFDSAMYRVSALQDARMDFERFSDFADLAFLVEVSQKGGCGFLKAPLVNYRVHPAQDSKALKKTYENGALEILRLYGKILPMHRFAPNFLLRTYASINKGFFDCVRFLKKCHAQGVLRYRDFFFLDAWGFASLFSIVLKSKTVLEAARWIKNLSR